MAQGRQASLQTLCVSASKKSRINKLPFVPIFAGEKFLKISHGRIIANLTVGGG